MFCFVFFFLLKVPFLPCSINSAHKILLVTSYYEELPSAVLPMGRFDRIQLLLLKENTKDLHLPVFPSCALSLQDK